MDNLSDAYVEDLMTQAEPDPASSSPGSPCASATATQGAAASPLPAVSAAAAVVEALRSSLGSGLGSGLVAELEALAEGVRAYVAAVRPSATQAAATVWHRVAAWVGSLRARAESLAAGGACHLAGLRAALPAQLSELREALGPEALSTRLEALRQALPAHAALGAEAASAVAANVRAAAESLGRRAAAALVAARKRAGMARWDWAHVALAAAAVSALMLLAGSCKANARLATRLAEREEQLAELVRSGAAGPQVAAPRPTAPASPPAPTHASCPTPPLQLTRIVKLQASMRNRTVPIIRHASACSTSAAAAPCFAVVGSAAAGGSAGGYPLVALAAV